MLMWSMPVETKGVDCARAGAVAPAAAIAVRPATRSRRESAPRSKRSTSPEISRSIAVPGVHQERRRVVAAAALERDPAHLRELVDAGLAAVPPEPAEADAAEGHVRLVVDRAVVDVRHARAQAPRDREAALLVARDDAGREPVLRVVRELDGLVDALDRDDRCDRAEGLLAHDLHVLRDAGQHGRLEEEALVLAAAEHLRALLDGVVDLIANLVELLLVDDRPDAIRHLARIADLELLRVLHELLRELGGHGLVHEDALDGHADLPLVHERAEGRGVHGVLDIGIVEHDQRVLAAELDAALLEQAAGLGRNLRADRARAREAHAAHERIRDQLVADFHDVVARARDDVAHAFRGPGLLDGLGGPQAPRGGRLLGPLAPHGGS